MRILIVDDSEVMRRGLRALLSAQPGMTVVGEAVDGEEVAGAVRQLAPDLMIMDVEMPRIGGLAALRELAAGGLPHPKVLMASLFCESELIVQSLRAGASGYVFKHRLGQDLPRAIATIADGGFFVSRDSELARVHAPAVTTELMRRLPSSHGRLLELLGEGRSDAHAADSLGMSEGEVGRLLRHLTACLCLTSREELAAFARREAVSFPSPSRP